jgi:hypothetical protein
MGGAPVRVRVGGRELQGACIFDFRAIPEYPRGLHRPLYTLWQEPAVPAQNYILAEFSRFK